MMKKKENLIKVENLSKKFCHNFKRSLIYGIKDIGKEILRIQTSPYCFNNADHKPSSSNTLCMLPTDVIKLRPDEFWALNDVSFELNRGECLGLIGGNGAGKSTLLKLLNGLIKPDFGRVLIRGRVGGIIEIESGFLPILTGRENIYISGSIIGLKKKEINRKFDEIVAFSELEEFIDMPVCHYSPGMKVRLGFSVALQLKPDVLIIDEVLAVGDAEFKTKCISAISKILDDTAIIFVSHSMHQVAKLSTRLLVLSHGQIANN